MNDGKIMDKAYFEKRYIVLQPIDQQYIEITIEEFKLNKEQERVFRIVAYHAVSFTTNQLKMYLGGMGGMGKSTVMDSQSPHVLYLPNKLLNFYFILTASSLD